MNISADLIAQTQQAIIDYNGQTIPLEAISIQETRKEFEGEMTIVTFPFIKFTQKSPEETWHYTCACLVCVGNMAMCHVV